MASDRKGVLLRFPPDLLELVDEQRGVQDRTPFLLDLIRVGLDTEDDIQEMDRAGDSDAVILAKALADHARTLAADEQSACALS